MIKIFAQYKIFNRFLICIISLLLSFTNINQLAAAENPLRCGIVSRLQSSGTRSGGSYVVYPITCTVVVDSISIKNLEVNRGNCPLITPSTIAMMHLMGESLNPLDALLNQPLKFGYTFEIPGSDQCPNPIEWIIWTSDGQSYKWTR